MTVLYVARPTRKWNVSVARLLGTRATFRQSLMGVGCTELIFVDPGAKINEQYHWDILLS